MTRALLAVEVGTAVPLWLAGQPPLRVALLSLLAMMLTACGILGVWIWRDTRPSATRNDARIRRDVEAWRRTHIRRIP